MQFLLLGELQQPTSGIREIHKAYYTNKRVYGMVSLINIWMPPAVCGLGLGTKPNIYFRQTLPFGLDLSTFNRRLRAKK
jgi:hypothetical protein